MKKLIVLCTLTLGLTQVLSTSCVYTRSYRGPVEAQYIPEAPAGTDATGHWTTANDLQQTSANSQTSTYRRAPARRQASARPQTATRSSRSYRGHTRGANIPTAPQGVQATGHWTQATDLASDIDEEDTEITDMNN